MLEYYLAGASLRFAETIIQASIWIVIGCLIAAVFRRMMGPEKVKRLFADDTRWGLLLGWLMGMLLPVCSLGVIPVVRELHRAGVKRGTIVAFGLTAPLFNPMSVLYGLTLSDPIAILSFSFCALVLVSTLGLVWERVSGVGAEANSAEALPEVGLRRILAVIQTASRELVGPSIGYILIGVVGAVVLAVALNKGLLQNQVERDNPWAPITMAVVATPVYSTPLLAMSQIGGMFQHGNSIGAAFTLLVFGAGANLGLLAWFGRTYGAARVLLLYVILFGTSTGLAYMIDKPLIPKGSEPLGHTHAFDVYTHPFYSNQANLYQTAGFKIQEFWQGNENGGTIMLLAFMGLGAAFSFSQLFFDLESWLVAPNDNAAVGGQFDLVVPGWVLGMITIVGLVGASVMACFLYFPPVDEVLDELSVYNTECVLDARNGKWESAEKLREHCDDLSRRMEVGVYLRTGASDEFQSARAKNYRDKLDRLKDAMEADNHQSAKQYAQEVNSAYRLMKQAFQEDESGSQ